MTLEISEAVSSAESNNTFDVSIKKGANLPPLLLFCLKTIIA